MRTIEWNVEMNINGCDASGCFEIETDATDDEIDQAVRDEISNHVS